jgi:hypothetical protein
MRALVVGYKKHAVDIENREDEVFDLHPDRAVEINFVRRTQAKLCSRFNHDVSSG